MAPVTLRSGLAAAAVAAVVAPILAALPGCDPLATGAYEGQPLATVVGGVFEDEPGLIHRDDLRAAVFWSPGDLDAGDPDSLVEQPSTGQRVGIPNDYVLHLFEAPDEALFVPTDGGGYAVGRILVYPDEEGDGRRGADETFLGAVLHSAVVWAPAPLPASESPTGRALPAGFHVTVLPMRCDVVPAGPDPRRHCGVDLGAPCEADADCGAGTCLTSQEFLTFPWPGGACALAQESGPGGCRPGGAGLVAALPGSPTRAWWVAGCAADADCARAEPYVCDVGAGACVPDVPLRISLVVDPTPSPLCGQGPGGSGGSTP